MGDDPVVILSYARTPIGAFLGVFKTVSTPQLGARAIDAAVRRAGIEAAAVDGAIMGCVLTAGLGQAPARQAALGAGMPSSVDCTTVNKMCGSGMKAVMLAHDMITAGSGALMVAGGMESMSNAPYLIPQARSGLRLGHGEIQDHMFLDGLEDAYERGRLMGSFAEECAESYGFSRAQQDDFAVASLLRAKKAAAGDFSREIVSMKLSGGKDMAPVETDELPARAQPEKIPLLRPAFRENGTITAGNASGISDGAAALVLARRSYAEKHGLAPVAAILGHAVHAQKPALFTTAPVFAIRKLLEKTGWSSGAIDLFEINEAFAVVVLAAMRDLRLSHDKVNVHGGACALGHPIGASGARILVTLLAALERYDLKRGVAALCIGGGEATAVAVERLT